MSSRVRRIHALLREANVPCTLGAVAELGLVLQAGAPDGDSWDVLLADTGGGLWVQDARGTTQLPDGASDATVADTVKLHVVQAWADRGNPEATALIARLADAGRDASMPQEVRWPALDVLSLLNPLSIAEQLFDSASYLGNLFLSAQPGAIDFAVWSPWGPIRGRYTRH